jgi:hypothetical protein
MSCPSGVGPSGITSASDCAKIDSTFSSNCRGSYDNTGAYSTVCTGWKRSSIISFTKGCTLRAKQDPRTSSWSATCS